MRLRRLQGLAAAVGEQLDTKFDRTGGEISGDLVIAGGSSSGEASVTSLTAFVDGELEAGTVSTPHVFRSFSQSRLDQTTLGGLTSGGFKWAGGVLAPNGKIYCAPLATDSVLIIDPSTNTLDSTTISGIGTQSTDYTGAVLGKDGNMYCVPRNGDKVLVIDTTTDTFSFIEGASQASADVWRQRDSAGSYNWRGICFSPELRRFVAVAVFRGASGMDTGNNRRVMTAENNPIWTSRASGVLINNCNNAAGNQITCTSTAGLTVGMTVGLPDGSGTDDITILSIDSPTAFTTSALISELSNTQLAADNSWISVCWSKERALFVAVAVNGTGNRIMTSPNGFTWTRRASPADNNWHSVCWSSELGLFVAVSALSNAEPTKRCMTSPDGIDWTLQTTPENEWRSVIWAAELGLFVAVANSGTGDRVMTSPNGSTWTSQASAVDNQWFSVAWSPQLRLLAAVSIDGTGNRVMTSRDGITWTSRASASDNAWFSIAWSPELGTFAVVGAAANVMVSRDGIQWSLRSAPSSTWSAITWAPSLRIFAGVSSGGLALTSGLEHTKWLGGVLASDNKIYCIPRMAERVLVIDPATRGLSFIELDPSLVPETLHKWVLGAIGGDGLIYGIPNNSDKILVIDPVAGTATDAGFTPVGLSTLVGNGKYEGGVLGPDGKIYGMPFGANNFLIIDPIAKTYDTVTLTTGAGNGKAIGGALGQDGRIYSIPWDQNIVYEIDPTVVPPTLSSSLVVSPVPIPSNAKWAGGVLAPNGNIYAVPSNAPSVMIIRTGLPRYDDWMLGATFNKL
jgi:hypothetical protein